MRLWFVRLLLVQFLLMMPVHALRPMVSYRALELGATPIELGIVAGGYGVLSFVFSVPLGRWVDRWGEPRFLVLGSSLALCATILILPVVNLWVLAFVFALLGLGPVTTIIGLQALTANAGRSDRRDARFGATSISAASSQMIGPPLGGLVFSLSGGSLDSVFVAALPVMLLSVVSAMTLLLWPPTDRESRDGSHGGPDDERIGMRRAVSTVLRVPNVPHAMVASLTVLAANDLITAYLPAYGEANDISVEVVSLLLGLRAAASVASRIGLLALAGRFGRRNVLTFSMITAMAGLLLLPTTAEPATLAVLLVLAGLGLGLGQPLSLAWITDVVTPGLRGTALGVRMTGNRVGQMGVPVIAGAIAGATGISAVFVITGVMLAVSSAVVSRAPSDGRLPR